ncbi:14090_t:CDS:1, partial [Acaulospora colombiana]
PTMSAADTRRYWASFINTHQRKDTISTLGISDSSSPKQPEFPIIYQYFIFQLSNLEHLVLEGGAAVLGLKAMVSANQVPSMLTKLTISNSKEVKKDHIDALVRVLNVPPPQQVSLQIKDCPSLSDTAEERLLLGDIAA